MHLKIDTLLDAFEFVSADSPFEDEAYLCLEAGTIHYHSELCDLEEALPEDIDNTEKYIAIPHKNDLELGKRLALRFVAHALPDALDDAYDMFRRKGAYSRFRALLERRNVLEQWYAHEEEAKKEALRGWCEANGIEIAG